MFGGIFGLPHEHEDIEVFTCSREAAIEAIQSGEINNATAIMALQWLRIELSKVKAGLGLMSLRPRRRPGSQ